MATYGWGLLSRIPLFEDRPRVRTPPEVLRDFAISSFIGYRYATHPLTRVLIDTSNISSRGVGGPSDYPTSTTAPGGKGRTVRTAPGSNGQ